jgi:hypothetical protein
MGCLSEIEANAQIVVKFDFGTIVMATLRRVYTFQCTIGDLAAFRSSEKAGTRFAEEEAIGV